MHAHLNIAVRAARRAGDIIARYSQRLDEVTVTAKRRNDFVTGVDRLAEDAIKEVVRRAYPGHAFLAEESGAEGDAETVWIIDPLDGTTNFIHGIPHYAVSIAVRQRGRLEHGVVYDPIRQELFTTSRGTGAQLDGRRIRVGPRRSLTDAVIGTGIPFRDMTHVDAYFGMLRQVTQKTAGIRRAGSAALDLAYVAAGRLDGFWEIGLQPWDIAAGALLVQEAGGVNGDLEGEPRFMGSGNIVCGNPRLFAALVREIGPFLTPALRGTGNG
ncbi:MAG TPA: inositol monophosphatase family protein [Gammaproteobacteria bacterium]|nr:inositol monophosphatase family protein [Gammaproteobacteria bacterium]